MPPGQGGTTTAHGADPPPPPPIEPVQPTTPREMLSAARAALGRGDASACVTLVERALESGAPAVALRVKGDCLLRAGRQSEALEAYRRFCLLVPDHPAIGEVRGIVEGLGGTCP